LVVTWRNNCLYGRNWKASSW